MPEIQSRITGGSDYLIGSKDLQRHGTHIWIEELSYSSNHLSLTYCLAATRAAEGVESTPSLGREVSGLLSSSPKMIMYFQGFFSTLPEFTSEPSWELEHWILQAFQFSRRLGRSGLDLLTRKKTSAYSPFTWISIANGSENMSLSHSGR